MKFLQIFYFFILIITTSCVKLATEKILSFKPIPTVNAILIDRNILAVHISLAGKLDSIEINYVSNANVNLLINEVFAETLIYIDSGFYQSSVIIESGKTYKCVVNIPNYDEIICEQTIPNKPSLGKIKHINIAGKDEEGTSYPAIKLTFENILESSYYEVEIRTVREFRGEIRIGETSITPIVEPVILNEGIPIPLFSNELIKDSCYTLNLNYTTHTSTSRNGGPWRTSLDPFVVELRRVTKDYYRYKKQLYLYKQGLLADGIINSMTSTNVYSNIENGYGIFAGYSYVVSDTIYPNLEGYYD